MNKLKNNKFNKHNHSVLWIIFLTFWILLFAFALLLSGFALAGINVLDLLNNPNMKTGLYVATIVIGLIGFVFLDKKATGD